MKAIPILFCFAFVIAQSDGIATKAIKAPIFQSPAERPMPISPAAIQTPTPRQTPETKSPTTIRQTPLTPSPVATTPPKVEQPVAVPTY